MSINLEAVVMKYKSTLEKIEGGHSTSIIEFNQEVKDGITNKAEIINPASKISWVNLQDAYKSYNTEGIWEDISKGDVPSLIIQRMEEAWSFQKMFNSSGLIEFPNIDSEILLILDKIKSVLNNWIQYIVECREMYFDYGGILK